MIGPNAPWPLWFLFGWAGLSLLLVGLAAAIGGLGLGLWWVISHLAWV